MKRFTFALLALTSLASTVVTPAKAQDTTEIPPEIMYMITGDISTIHMDVMQATILLEPGQSSAFWAFYEEYL